MTLCEIGRPTLTELLALTALIAQKDERRRERVTARWLLRYLQEHEHATIVAWRGRTAHTNRLMGTPSGVAFLPPGDSAVRVTKTLRGKSLQPSRALDAGLAS